MVEAAAYGGVLERLRAFAKWFAESCDWSRAGMTQGILTVVVDEPPQIRVTRRSQATLTRRPKFETDRLLLDVRPTVAAEQVREVYRDAREYASLSCTRRQAPAHRDCRVRESRAPDPAVCQRLARLWRESFRTVIRGGFWLLRPQQPRRLSKESSNHCLTSSSQPAAPDTCRGRACNQARHAWPLPHSSDARRTRKRGIHDAQVPDNDS